MNRIIYWYYVNTRFKISQDIESFHQNFDLKKWHLTARVAEQDENFHTSFFESFNLKCINYKTIWNYLHYEKRKIKIIYEQF